MRNPSPPTRWIIQGQGIRLGIEELNQRLQLSVWLSAAPLAAVTSSLAQHRFFIGSWMIRAQADFGERWECWDRKSHMQHVSSLWAGWTLCAAQAIQHSSALLLFQPESTILIYAAFRPPPPTHPPPVTSFAYKPSVGVFASYYGSLNNI